MGTQAPRGGKGSRGPTPAGGRSGRESGASPALKMAARSGGAAAASPKRRVLSARGGGQGRGRPRRVPARSHSRGPGEKRVCRLHGTRRRRSSLPPRGLRSLFLWPVFLFGRTERRAGGRESARPDSCPAGCQAPLPGPCVPEGPAISISIYLYRYI